jgi:hypothetical protein
VRNVAGNLVGLEAEARRSASRDGALAGLDANVLKLTSANDDDIATFESGAPGSAKAVVTLGEPREGGRARGARRPPARVRQARATSHRGHASLDRDGRVRPSDAHLADGLVVMEGFAVPLRVAALVAEENLSTWRDGNLAVREGEPTVAEVRAQTVPSSHAGS